MKRRVTVVTTLALPLLAGVGGASAGPPPIATVRHFDLPRFMGRWYVIASIPTRFERGAHNAVEYYTLQKNGEVCTRFRLRKGGFDQPLKWISSLGEVQPHTGNAVWSIKLFWFLHTQYKVAWLAPDYSQVIVARDKRDHTWLMARSPHISSVDYQTMVQRVARMGYATDKLVKVPQQWPEPYTSPDDEERKACN